MLKESPLTGRAAPTLRVDTPVFQPRSQSPTPKNLAAAANAAVFIPRSSGVPTTGRTESGLSSPPLANSTLATPEPQTVAPALTPLASSLYARQVDVVDDSTPMSQPSLSQTSENNPYTDYDNYAGNSNYMDQVTNGYNQMNLGPQVPLLFAVASSPCHLFPRPSSR